jgi:hypothetical protein
LGLETTLKTTEENVPDLTVQLYAPHKGQWRIHRALEQHRFVTAICGRRFGKTFCADNELAKHACEVPYSLNWWVAPTYRQAYTPFEQAARALYPILKRKPNESNLKLVLKNDSVIEYRSGEDPENLRGDGPYFVVMDEIRKIKAKAWKEVLRPAVVDRQGSALFISTPNGHDWGYDMFLMGQDPHKTWYGSLQLPSWENPFLPKEEIEEARNTLPDRVFRQEFGAEFLEGAGVFRNVAGCVRGTLAEPAGDHMYVLGWDVAKYQDFSVMTVIDVNRRHVVAYLRLKHIEYPLQLAHVVALARRYNDAAIVMDSTGVGDPLFDMLRQLDMTIEPYYFTHSAKNKLVDELVIAIEHGHVSFPDIPELIGELNAFSYTITEARNIVYSAPDGLHDDFVFSLALAVHGMGSGAEIALIGRTVREADKQLPKAWETKDEAIDRRQAQIASVMRQVLTGQGIVRTRWAQESEGNRFEREQEDEEASIV